MTSSLPQVSLRAGTSVSGSPSTPTLMTTLQAAVQGGSATYDLFSADAAARQQLAQLVGKGQQVWTLHQTGSELGLDFLQPDQPAYVAAQGANQLILQTQLSPQVMQADTGSDYKEAGIATMYMVTDQTPIDVFVCTVEKLGPAITAAALGPAMATLLGALRTFITSFFTSVCDAAGEAAGADAVASAAAESAATTAEVDGEIVADELALSVEFGPLAIAGLVIAAVTIVAMIVSFGLSKTMTARIRVFNTSAYPVTVNLAYNYNLAIAQQPSSGVLPPPGLAPSPPGVTAGSSVVYRADYVLRNDTTTKGLGVVLQVPPTDDYTGLTLAIDIPSVGANSFAVTPDGQVDPSTFYGGNEGDNTSLSTWISGDGLGFDIGTNQTSGQSPDPLTGQDGYNYEYVAVIS